VQLVWQVVQLSIVFSLSLQILVVLVYSGDVDFFYAVALYISYNFALENSLETACCNSK
jgi:hypothetical protein